MTLDVDPDLLRRGHVRVALEPTPAGADTRATVTLARPEQRNAQTPSMWAALAAVGRALPASVRVVVLQGDGAAFSAGLDRGMLSPDGIPGEQSVLDLLQHSDADIVDTIGVYQEGFTWLRDPRFVSIAAVRGYAIGAGFQLALACDLRVIAEDTRFCMKEPALGLVPDLTGTKPLVELVGYARALEICATARYVEAPEALAIGLAARVVPGDELDAAVAQLTEALTATSVGAVRGTKALLQGAAGRDLAAQSLAERTEQVARMRELAELLG
ncbi:enoyl-CoA hydratase/isomerase family protein [Nocardioides massiliensis]|uniref:Enoyl-CoA hydratase/carnithine racemase n=1 Tax=Nocardioides massiliensis TaxID=1325935 RepID=A0ABT9NTB1_9ACTN|nr:enoyl-CoA hydratase/isomerase family protein [Nocardioides massiliensis]MDP9823100.1 enoyl-CoA hydratase/carnithine racemase [Nocardioides massiliensis]